MSKNDDDDWNESFTDDSLKVNPPEVSNNPDVSEGPLTKENPPEVSNNSNNVSNDDDEQEKVFFLCTHNGRMRQMIYNIKNYLGVYLNEDIIRFQNCAVLKFNFSTDHFCCKLKYPGNIANSDNESPSINRQYYTTGVSTDTSYKYFEPITLRTPVLLQKLYQKLQINPTGNGFIVYVVRHAQGLHNASTKSEKAFNFYDSPITPDGIRQAETCGIFLRNLSDKNNLLNALLGASVLWRSQQTLSIIMFNLNEETKFNLLKYIFIIPCSHEISFKKDKIASSDKRSMIDISIKSGLSYENNYNPADRERNNKFLKENYGISLNWRYYETVKNNNCMSSNIFFELSKLVKSPQEPQDISPQDISPQDSVDNNSTKIKKWWKIFGGRNKTKKRKSRKVKRSRKVRKSKKVKRSRKSI
jgi:hypothetical protein